MYTWLLTNIYNTWIKTKGKYTDKTWLIQKLNPKSLSEALGFSSGKKASNHKYIQII